VKSHIFAAKSNASSSCLCRSSSASNASTREEFISTGNSVNMREIAPRVSRFPVLLYPRCQIWVEEIEGSANGAFDNVHQA
jgi:hypothetical protein